MKHFPSESDEKREFSQFPKDLDVDSFPSPDEIPAKPVDYSSPPPPPPSSPSSPPSSPLLSDPASMPSQSPSLASSEVVENEWEETNKLVEILRSYPTYENMPFESETYIYYDYVKAVAALLFMATSIFTFMKHSLMTTVYNLLLGFITLMLARRVFYYAWNREYFMYREESFMRYVEELLTRIQGFSTFKLHYVVSVTLSSSKKKLNGF